MHLLQIWTRFYILYVREESEVVSGKSSLKKEGVLTNSAKLTGKYLQQGLICNKAAGLENCNFIK